MLLIDLLAVLAIGLACWFVSYIVDLLQSAFSRYTKRRQQKPPRRVRRRQIETDLDHLLARYQQGTLDERQYYYQANQLIDQLADVLNPGSTVVH
jgi:hypothetical protein